MYIIANYAEMLGFINAIENEFMLFLYDYSMFVYNIIAKLNSPTIISKLISGLKSVY